MTWPIGAATLVVAIGAWTARAAADDPARRILADSEAAVRQWFSSPDPLAARRAAAEAYHRFQGCGRRAALRLFSGEN